MTSINPAMNKNSSVQYVPDKFEVLMPLSALPLVMLVLLILPIAILAAESLFTPVYEYIKSLLLPVNVDIAYTHFPLLLMLKIVLFSFFCFTGVTMLMLKIAVIYHEVWSYFLPRPHSQHVDYHPDQQESLVALLNWNLFRWYKVVSPLAGWILAMILVTVVGYWWFNMSTSFDKLMFQLQVALGFFSYAAIGMFIFFSFFSFIWRMFTTIMGDVIAITEPEKPTQTVYERSKRLVFASPWTYFLYPAYFIFYVAVAAEIIMLIAFYDIYDFLTFQFSILNIFGIELITFVVYIVLSGFKFLTYHDALTRFYQKNVH